MSCPAKLAVPFAPSLRPNTSDADMDTALPAGFYPLTLLMVALVLGVPFLYRWLWLFTWDVVAGVVQDLKRLPAPKGCRRVGSGNESGSSHSSPADRDKTKAIHPIQHCAALKVDPGTELTSIDYACSGLLTFAQQTTSLPDSTGKVNSTWNTLTANSHSRLPLISCEVWLPDTAAPDYDERADWVIRGGCLIVRFSFTPDTVFGRESLRAGISSTVMRWRTRKWTVEPIIEFRLPLLRDVDPTDYRIFKNKNEKKYPVERVQHVYSTTNDKSTDEAWNLGEDVPPFAMSKLQYHLGVSNPLSIFRIRGID